MLETSITSVWDELPSKYKIKRTYLLIATCILMFFFEFPFVTQVRSRRGGRRTNERGDMGLQGGMFLFQLVDTYAATYTVIVVCIFEVVTVAWVYGAERFLDDIAFMIGYKPFELFWSFVWRGTASAMTIV